MFVVLVYDVNRKRVAKVHKICKKYLLSTQRSVLEGDITRGKLVQLQKELERVVNKREDSICIYEMDSKLFIYKTQIGVVETRGNKL